MAERHRPLRTRSGRKLVARRDTLDFRDQMYAPTLVEVPPERALSAYRAKRVPILDQGQEGACTGFGLATVANFLLQTRKVEPDRRKVSPWMLYHLARRYDEWPAENYDGSSARGAMKGWHKHGVCAERLWDAAGPGDTTARTPDPWTEALLRPLGAYYRVNHRDLVAMHAAITEVGVLYATSDVHQGWDDVRPDGMIRTSDDILGGHAFAIVAYDASGFWIQNSWGAKWGRGGFGHLSYDDWLANGTDVWVARLGVPVQLAMPDSASVATTNAAKGSRAAAIRDIRPHVVSIGNDGVLRPGGEYGTTAESLTRLFDAEIPAVMGKWKQPRILLYAHGGLVDEQSAVQKVAAYRGALLENEVYPLAFVWKTDFATTLKNIVQDALSRRRTEGILDAAKDFMLDRLDDALEPIARVVSGKAEWDEMKENARLATEGTKGGARLVLAALEKLCERFPALEIHIAAHSAGSIFMGPFLKRLTQKREVSTCTLWAPACTMSLFEECYLPAVEQQRVKHFSLYTLTDRAEQDDNCANIYHKSLLYLVSNAFEEKPRIPMFRDGIAILGMEKFVRRHSALHSLFKTERAQWVRSPNTEDEGTPGAAAAKHHADFDDDRASLLGTLNRISGVKIPPAALSIPRTTAERRERRMALTGPPTSI